MQLVQTGNPMEFLRFNVVSDETVNVESQCVNTVVDSGLNTPVSGITHCGVNSGANSGVNRVTLEHLVSPRANVVDKRRWTKPLAHQTTTLRDCEHIHEWARKVRKPQ